MARPVDAHHVCYMPLHARECRANVDACKCMYMDERVGSAYSTVSRRQPLGASASGLPSLVALIIGMRIETQGITSTPSLFRRSYHSYYAMLATSWANQPLWWLGRKWEWEETIHPACPTNQTTPLFLPPPEAPFYVCLYRSPMTFL